MDLCLKSYLFSDFKYVVVTLDPVDIDEYSHKHGLMNRVTLDSGIIESMVGGPSSPHKASFSAYTVRVI